MLPLIAAQGVLQAGYGLYNMLDGNSKEKELKKKQEELERTRPKYNISDVAKQEKSLAESELAQGMSAGTETAYNRATDKDLSTSIGALLKSGANVNSVSELFDKSQEGRSRLAVMKENERVQHIQNLVSSYRNMQEQQDKAFQINEEDPYRNQAAALSQSMMAAEGQKQSGIGSIFGAGLNTLGGIQNQMNYDNYFKLMGGNKTQQPTANGGSFPEKGIIDAFKGLQNVGGMQTLATDLNSAAGKLKDYGYTIPSGGTFPQQGMVDAYKGLGNIDYAQNLGGKYSSLGSLMTNPDKIDLQQDFFLK